MVVDGQPSNILVDAPTHHFGTDLHVCAAWICPELGYATSPFFGVAGHWIVEYLKILDKSQSE